MGLGFTATEVQYGAINAGFDTDDFLHKGATAVSVGNCLCDQNRSYLGRTPGR
jgi:hypothetical protein